MEAKKKAAKESYMKARSEWEKYTESLDENLSALAKVRKAQSGPEWEKLQDAIKVCRRLGVMV